MQKLIGIRLITLCATLPLRLTQKQQSPAQSVAKEGGKDGPEQVPDLKNTVNEQLGRRVGNADVFKNALQVIRDQTVTRPLTEESDGNDNAHTLPVSFCGNQGLPANVGGNGAVELDGALDFFKFIQYKRVLIISLISEMRKS